MVLLELVFCGLSISTEQLGHIRHPMSDVRLTDTSLVLSRDLEEYDKWLFVGDVDSAELRVPPEFKESLFEALPEFMDSDEPLTYSQRDTGLVESHDERLNWSPAIVLCQLVDALREIGCDRVRFTTSDLFPHHFIDRPHVSAFDTALARTTPSLGSLGRGGFGWLQIPLPGREDGIRELRVSHRLVTALTKTGYYIDPRRFPFDIDDKGIFNEAIGKANSWMAMAGEIPPSKLYGAELQLSVQAQTVQQARSAVRASGLLNWQGLLEGRLTGCPLDIRTLDRSKYLQYVDHTIASARNDVEALNRNFDPEQADRLVERLWHDLGYDDPHSHPPDSSEYAD
ncbi:uncharacterized protein PFL1_01490 [Pseudozyma flocculosa PF-1]|uniref:uncharacterized protein n=1 Tax=Pseudozyma flocculosa PF-1 TaxID=1277687 RepID=UPI0004560C6B|nr:uncharacterized protein PFL1_01490 [Pseudozyma flocculosa PF-1]EPQ31305.1 hypothetical protein PFL1_01490 [Pseudozyma flocculosa PF-1]